MWRGTVEEWDRTGWRVALGTFGAEKVLGGDNQGPGREGFPFCREHWFINPRDCEHFSVHRPKLS